VAATDLFAHGPTGNGGMRPSVCSFAALPGSGFTITMPPSSGVTPVSGRTLAPCVTTTSVPGSVHAAIIARAPEVNSPTRSRNVKALLKVGERREDRSAKSARTSQSHQSHGCASPKRGRRTCWRWARTKRTASSPASHSEESQPVICAAEEGRLILAPSERSSADAALALTLPRDYIRAMCGRVIQSGGPLRYAIVDGMNVRDSRMHNYPPRWNAAPSQDLLVIRRNHKTGQISLDPLRWGLIPYWCSDPRGGRKPINAKCESVRDLPTFRDAYRMRRCIVPVDGFFEWKAIKGQKAKQPYAIAMKDGAPFGLAGIWENWKEPASGEWIRTFAIITTDANELVAEIHDRMPLILAPGDYARWLGEEPDPRDLMRPFPAAPMRMWPISTRVNKPENDDAAIVEPIEVATDAA